MQRDGFATGLMFLLALLAGGALLGASPARADPILFEVCYDGPGADADDVFTELFGTPGRELDGWSIVGVNGSNGSVYRTISLTGLTIPMDGILVIATANAAGVVLAARDVTANVDWQNGADAVRLLNPDGLVSDALQYGTLGNFQAGEGTAATDVAAGWSLSRDIWGSDTDDNATDFTGLSTPTPGVGPTTPVPEPGTLALMLAGGAALGLERRRARRRPKAERRSG